MYDLGFTAEASPEGMGVGFRVWCLQVVMVCCNMRRQCGTIIGELYSILRGLGCHDPAG